MRNGAETLQNLSKDVSKLVVLFEIIQNYFFIFLISFFQVNACKENNEDLRHRVNRERNPTDVMKSPFNVRKVDILTKFNKIEKSVLELIKKKNNSNLA